MALSFFHTRTAVAVPAVVLGLGLCLCGQPLTSLASTPQTAAAPSATAQQAAKVPATAISLDEDSLNLMVGSAQTLTATVDPAQATDTITWSSSNPQVATVSDDGTVQAVHAGTTTVTAQAGEVQASCEVTTWQPVTSITLNRTAFSMEGGEVRQLSATCAPDDATNKTVVWESSNPKVATVNAQTGLVSAASAGTTTITARAADGAGAQQTCEVTVTSNAYTATTVDQLQSAHPYANNCTDSWTYSIPGASALSVTFDSRTSVENTFDYIKVFDADGSMLQAYTGTALAGATLTIPGDSVRIQLVTDDQVTDWGFAVTSVEQAAAPKEEEKPEQPAQPEAPTTPDTPDTPDEPSTPATDWNLTVGTDGTVASDYVTFQLPEAWIGKVDVAVTPATGDTASQLTISLAGHPDLALASFVLTPTGELPSPDSDTTIPVTTWDNGNGETLELQIVDWAAIAYNPTDSTPSDDLLSQLVSLSTGGSLTLEELQGATEAPAIPTYGADALTTSAQVPLYVDGKAVGYAVPAALPMPIDPATPEIPAADEPAAPAAPSDDAQATTDSDDAQTDADEDSTQDDASDGDAQPAADQPDSPAKTESTN